MSFSETIFLFVLALVIFGPKKLPGIARQVGRMLNEVKRASNEFKSQIEQEVNNLERDESRKILPPVTPADGSTVSRQLGPTSSAAPSPAHAPSDSEPLPAAGQESHGG